MYDEPWILFAGFRTVLSAVANPSNPHFGYNWDWMAYHLDPSKEERGWAPHRDFSSMPFEHDGSPSYCSLWVALTDATPDNGCMVWPNPNPNPNSNPDPCFRCACQLVSTRHTTTVRLQMRRREHHLHQKWKKMSLVGAMET